MTTTSDLARGRQGRIKLWSKLSAQELWLLWCYQFETEDEALVTAIWIANRLIKTCSRNSRTRFYSIKDEFIRRHSEEGQQTRLEKTECRECEGKGDDGSGWCERCDGSGIWRERWLYLHTMTVAGRRYAFHSYQEPKLLLDGTSGDDERFGGLFSEEELNDLALPVSGLLKMLSYVAAAIWKLRYLNRRYA